MLGLFSDQVGRVVHVQLCKRGTPCTADIDACALRDCSCLQMTSDAASACRRLPAYEERFVDRPHAQQYAAGAAM